MIPALKALSDPGGRQLLVTGRVADAISGRGVADATIMLAYDAAGAGLFQALPAQLARRDDGWFGFHIAPRQLPPPTGDAPVLRLSVSAQRYTGAQLPITPTPAELALASTDRSIFGHPIEIQRIAGAPFRCSIALMPQAVALEVMVLIAGDPATPAVGATVEMLTPPGAEMISDASGSCRFAPLPVAATVAFRVTRGPRVSTFNVRPDFTQPVNGTVFAVPV